MVKYKVTYKERIMELLQEYSELKKTIDYHMDRYYNQDEPEISDYEYDNL